MFRKKTTALSLGRGNQARPTVSQLVLKGVRLGEVEQGQGPSRHPHGLRRTKFISLVLFSFRSAPSRSDRSFTPARPVPLLLRQDSCYLFCYLVCSCFCFAVLCFALLCFALLCCVLLWSALLCFALFFILFLLLICLAKLCVVLPRTLPSEP